MGKVTDRIRTNGNASDPLARSTESLSANHNTRASYLKELEGFRTWINLSYEDLYILGVEASKSDDPSDRLIVLDKLAEYVNHVQTAQVSEISGRAYGYGKLKLIKQSVLKFYSANGIYFKVDRSHKLNALTKAHPSNLRKPSKDEIRELIGVCPNYRMKAAVALSKDSGLRVSDISSVKFKHIKDGLNSADGFGGFILTTEKTDRVAMPCFGPEATKYLRYWVAELERKLGRKLGDEDLIFPQVKNEDTRFTKLGAGSLDSLINNQIEKLGLEHQISANGLRYHFESSLETRLNKNIILKICGKGIPDSTKSYSKHDIEELLSLYRPAYGTLMVESNLEKDTDKKLAGVLATTARGLGASEEQIKRMMASFDAGLMSLEQFQTRIVEMMRETQDKKL
jgi:site-specific recombinase XerD